MTPTERSELIARYAEGHAAVIAALDRIGPDRLDTVPPDGSWTPRMVVHHLADSEMTSALRVRKLLAPFFAELEEAKLDALAWCFPPLVKPLVSPGRGNEALFYPGVVLLGRVVAEPGAAADGPRL